MTNAFSELFSRHSTNPSIERWPTPSGHPAHQAYRPRLARWILRIYAGSAVMPIPADSAPPRNPALADLLGVPELADASASAAAVSQAISAALQRLVPDSSSTTASTPSAQDCGMLRTVNWLAQGAGLDPLERDIFEFALATQLFGPLRTAVLSWGDIDYGDVVTGVALVLQAPVGSVAQALQPQGRLLTSGLLKLKVYHRDALHHLLYAPRILTQRLPFNEDDPALILSHLVRPLSRPNLLLTDFAHLRLDTRLAQCWLAGALLRARQGEPAGHMLVTGEPGLGKTEWVRALLHWALVMGVTRIVHDKAAPQIQAMELVLVQDDGAALSGEERLSHLRLALSLLHHSPGAVIMFDEADDVFRAQSALGTSSGDDDAVSMTNHRASLNRLLEQSRLPIIWIMNHPEVLDPAVLRRFDAVVSFEAMPRSVRLALLNARLHHAGTPAERARWAELPTLTPALIDRLAVMHSRADEAGQAMDETLCRHWLHRRLPGPATRALTLGSVNPGSWSPESVNASHDLVALAEGIARSGTARILLHGAPGTGKTAYAHELARRLDRPLQGKRVSDLLSPWVGETEQRIAQAFAAALDDGAVLFIDEADSLLAGREQAVRQWEVTQVNELLEQLGDYPGVVVLATNRLSALDPAVLRRLDVKIRFDALNAEQVMRSFDQLCEQLGIERDLSTQRLVATWADLTPGDFAVLVRRHAFAPLADAQAVAVALREELTLKSGGKQPIGFHPQQVPLFTGAVADFSANLSALL